MAAHVSIWISGCPAYTVGDKRQRVALRLVSLMPEKFTSFDAADYLESEADIEAFLAAAEESKDAEHIRRAKHIADQARKRLQGM